MGMNSLRFGEAGKNHSSCSLIMALRMKEYVDRHFRGFGKFMIALNAISVEPDRRGPAASVSRLTPRR